MKKNSRYVHVVVVLATALWFLTASTGYAQRTKKTNMVVTKDTVKRATVQPLIAIEKIGDAITGSDTVKVGQMIAITLKTDLPLSKFNTLLVNGFKVNLVAEDSSDYEKVLYYEIDNKVVDVVGRFLERSGSAKTFVPIEISLGHENEKGVTVLTRSRQLYVIFKPRVSNVYIFVVVSAGIIFMVGLALWRNVLKDDNNLYYSLGRSQLFYWTVLFTIGYVYIWQRTDILPDLTPSMLVILGISISTTALGKVVENTTKAKTPIDRLAKSEGWFIDILSDSSSVNVQRFQNVLFNFVFGCIFIQRCISNEALPEFDNNILALMGLSSSTYAGLKVTEPLKEQKSELPVTGDDPVKDSNETGAPSPAVG